MAYSRNHIKTPRIVALLIAICLAATSSVLARQSLEPWVLVDTGKEQLLIKQKNTTVKVFNDIAIGRGGTAQLRVRDDGKTPLGEFEIAWVGEESQFHMFFGPN